jgi:hypothetical protein
MSVHRWQVYKIRLPSLYDDSMVLNMIVVPSLFFKFGRQPENADWRAICYM